VAVVVIKIDVATMEAVRMEAPVAVVDTETVVETTAVVADV